MTSSSNRLERALALFLEHQRVGGDWAALLARHPELADVLASFVETADDGAAPAAPPPRVVGEFELLRTIGRGGTGVVHEARQRGLGRQVALKLLHPEFATQPTALARFHREAQSLARLDHPGIVRVFATGEVDGAPWLAMELVDGTLAELLEQRRAAGGHRGDELRRLVEALAGIARALDHAHRAGIVHRDVKPSNILMRADGSAVLGDFGLARDADAPSLTQTGLVAGTPHYMAPEQLLGGSRACDARTDVFGLGATLYECLTLRRAFAGESTPEVLHAVLAATPIDPRRHHRGLPAELAAICLQALEREPGARYQTAQALADDLMAFLELRPVRAAAPTRLRRFWRRLRRQPLGLAFAALALVTLLLGGGFAWQLPALHAAARAQLDAEYEDSLVAGLLARAGSDRATCVDHLQRAIALAPERAEATAALCLALIHFDGAAAALAEIERRGGAASGQDLARCRALALRRLHRVDEAVALERQLGEPATPLAMWLAAAALTQDERDTVALREASRLLSLAVRTAPQPRLLLHVQWAVLQPALKDEAAGREAAEALVRLWPEHRLALYAAGVNLLHIDPVRAERLLRGAIERGLRDPLAHLNLGTAQYHAGRRDDAAATFETTLALPGLRDEHRTLLVQFVSRLGDTARVARMVEAWLQREPNGVGARRARARELGRAGDHVAAAALFRACLHDAPHDRGVAADLAFCLIADGEAEQALELLQPLVAAAPDDPHAHALLLDALDVLQRRGAALAEHRRWAERRPGDRDAWRDLAAALLASDDPADREPALSAAERADHLADGEDAAIVALRAAALDRLGHTAEAARLRAAAARR